MLQGEGIIVGHSYSDLGKPPFACDSMTTPDRPPEECGAYNPYAAVAGTFPCRRPRGHDGPHHHNPPELADRPRGVFTHCNVCGRKLHTEEEDQIGMCEVCGNLATPDRPPPLDPARDDIAQLLAELKSRGLPKLAEKVADLAAARALADEMATALGPFAEHAADIERRYSRWPDSDPASNVSGLTIGDCRRAAAALSRYRAAGRGEENG